MIGWVSYELFNSDGFGGGGERRRLLTSRGSDRLL